MSDRAININDPVVPEIPGIQRALGLTACVVLRSGGTLPRSRFFIAQADSTSSRFAQLLLALDAASAGDTLELKNGDFEIPAGQSLMSFSPPAGLSVYITPGTEVVYVDSADAEEDRPLYVDGSTIGTPDGPVVLSLLADQISLRPTVAESFRLPAVRDAQRMSRVHGRFLGNTTVAMTFLGDSRITGFGSDYPNMVTGIQTLLSECYHRHTIVNGGVSGSTSAMLLASIPAVLATNQDLIYIEIGYNDILAGINAAGTEANLRAILTLCRAHAAEPLMSIILASPVSGHDPGTGRTVQNLALLNPIYRELADEFQCAFLDNTNLWPWTAGSGAWQDDIHTRGAVHLLRAKAVMDMILPQTFRPFCLNDRLGFYSFSQYPSFLESAAPTGFGQGFNLGRATGANGWPLDGMFVHLKQPDGCFLQLNTNFASGASVVLMRTGNTGAWNPWMYFRQQSSPIVPAAGFTLPGADAARANVDGKTVTCDGYIAMTVPGTIAAGTVVMTIPGSFRPVPVMRGVRLRIWDGTNYETVHASVAGANSGAVTLEEPVTLNCQRIYMTGDAWTAAV